VKAVILEGDSVNPGDISWEPVTRLCETKIYGNTSENEKWERIELPRKGSNRNA
jgi:glycerate dehydrogenase